MAQIGVPSLILILVVALIIFGPSKLPEIGKATGNTLKEFKNATKGIMGNEETSNNSEENSVERDK